MTLQARYTALLELSQQMLTLAQNQDWELLAQKEAQRTVLLSATPAITAALPTRESHAIAECIRQIQACDSEILEYVIPWREQAAKLLTGLGPVTR